MSKVLMLVVILVGLILTLNVVGFSTPTAGFVFSIFNPTSYASNTTGTRALLNYSATELPIANAKGGNLWIKILAIFALVGTVGVVASIFVRTPDTSYLIGGIASIIASGVLVDLLYLLGEFWRFGMPYKMIGAFILVPLIIALPIMMIEWWRSST